MFNHIMVPVDLAHLDLLDRALEVTATTAKQEDARVTFVSATSAQPGSVAHTPEEFREKLTAFAQEQADRHGYSADAHALVLHDKSVDLDRALLSASEELNADLVIMASHEPSFANYFWSSNGGAVASHANASVMVVRDT